MRWLDCYFSCGKKLNKTSRWIHQKQTRQRNAPPDAKWNDHVTQRHKWNESCRFHSLPLNWSCAPPPPWLLLLGLAIPRTTKRAVFLIIAIIKGGWGGLPFHTKAKESGRFMEGFLWGQSQTLNCNLQLYFMSMIQIKHLQNTCPAWPVLLTRFRFHDIKHAMLTCTPVCGSWKERQ